MSKQTFRLVFFQSPFMPVFNWDETVAEIMADIIEYSLKPAPAVAIAAAPLIVTHSVFLKLKPDLLAEYQLAAKDLDFLSLGYLFPLETIKISAMCASVAPGEREDFINELATTTHHFMALSMQSRILENITRTVNLLNIDPTGAQIFDYLTRYPFSQHECFVNGFEMAEIIHSGLSQKVAEQMPHLTWLTTNTDPTNLG